MLQMGRGGVGGDGCVFCGVALRPQPDWAVCRHTCAGPPFPKPPVPQSTTVGAPPDMREAAD